jgi:hypothetical protein
LPIRHPGNPADHDPDKVSSMKRNSNLICSILVIALLGISDCSAFARAGGTATPQDFAAKVDEYMQAQTKLRRFSGSILVAREGKVLVAKGYGFANAEWNIPNTPQTRFRLGSITKQFTSMAVMQLQERGRLSVQDPICKYLNPCPASWKPVTIHHLLTHTSGIPSYTGLPDYRRKMMIPTSKEEVVARFRDLPLEFQPGERYKYDNSGYFLLGMILTVTREGSRLMTQATGQGKIEMFPESGTKFFNEAIDGEITFVTDEKGRATELILRQGGGERRALRLK